ncbi:toll/interleukin-1 receptor domain-containing protein [Algoriphagus halophilus]|uniref:toll/interleukin-1 receptor domain-containing protein n=1 Tax=Algoriphagus halophilus TaxID=226505 RepID=UPI00358DF3AA
MKDKYNAFISHSSNDKELVLSLATWLEAEGINTWLDLWNLTPGVDWQEAIENAVKEAEYFLILIGDKGLSNWNITELSEAIKYDNKKIIPILTNKNLDVIPVFLRDKKIIHINEKGAFDQLSALINPNKQLFQLNSIVKELVASGNYEEALNKSLEAIEIIEKNNFFNENATTTFNNLGLIYKTKVI